MPGLKPYEQGALEKGGYEETWLLPWKSSGVILPSQDAKCPRVTANADASGTLPEGRREDTLSNVTQSQRQKQNFKAGFLALRTKVSSPRGRISEVASKHTVPPPRALDARSHTTSGLTSSDTSAHFTQAETGKARACWGLLSCRCSREQTRASG